MSFMTTGERVQPVGEAPPMPGPPPLFPSKDEFAFTYYASTPVSSLPNNWLPISFASQITKSKQLLPISFALQIAKSISNM